MRRPRKFQSRPRNLSRQAVSKRIEFGPIIRASPRGPWVANERRNSHAERSPAPCPRTIFRVRTLLPAAPAFPRDTAREASAAIRLPCREPPTPLRRSTTRASASRPRRWASPSRLRRRVAARRRTTFVVTEASGRPRREEFFRLPPGVDGRRELRRKFPQGRDAAVVPPPRGKRGAGGYSVTDIRHGAKRLSEADLKIYFKRIEELQWVTRQEPPDRAELLEWLVRCPRSPRRVGRAHTNLPSAPSSRPPSRGGTGEGARRRRPVADATVENGGGEGLKAKTKTPANTSPKSLAGRTPGRSRRATPSRWRRRRASVVAADSEEVVEIDSEMRPFGRGVDSKLVRELTAGSRSDCGRALRRRKVGEARCTRLRRRELGRRAPRPLHHPSPAKTSGRPALRR